MNSGVQSGAQLNVAMRDDEHSPSEIDDGPSLTPSMRRSRCCSSASRASRGSEDDTYAGVCPGPLRRSVPALGRRLIQRREAAGRERLELGIVLAGELRLLGPPLRPASWKIAGTSGSDMRFS
jgi:hypothetical protein